MAQYIDKDALVAEIKRYKNKADERLKIKGRTLADERKDSALQNLCGNLLHFLDSLELKEVDLKKELSYEDYKGFFEKYPDLSDDWGFDEAWIFAKYFYSLGFKAAQKGE